MNIEKKEFSLLPPPPDVCQECAYNHAPDQPHNLQTLHYKVKFQMDHGRAPTWADAISHCDEATQAAWKRELAVVGVIV